MSKGAYVGVSGKARKVKKIYVGVNGVARKVKKGYIGVNGIAHKFFGGELGYYNTINLINYAPYPSAATTGNYAIFYIGYTGSYSGKVDACDKSLTVSNIQSMLNERIDTAATTVGDYAVFAGGSANGSTYFRLAGVYNSSLVYQEISNVLTYKTIDVGTTTIGDYALFVGGQGSSKYAQVNTLSSSLTKSGLTSLNDRGYSIAGATIGNYAIFAGGYREVNGNNSYSVSTSFRFIINT